MTAFLAISLFTLICLFILFLVLSRTLNNTVNNLTKIEYLLTSAREFGSEREEIARIMDEDGKL
jgi:hypothetical protein